MHTPDILDRYEAVELLSPLVLPMLQDKAKVGTPVGSNQAVAGVTIFNAGTYLTLTTEQYELFRVGVLQYLQGRLDGKHALSLTMSGPQVTKIIRDRVGEVFANA